MDGVQHCLEASSKDIHFSIFCRIFFLDDLYKCWSFARYIHPTFGSFVLS